MSNVNSSKGSRGLPKKSSNKQQKGRSYSLVSRNSIPSANINIFKNKKPIYTGLKDGSIDVSHSELFFSIPAGNWTANTALKTFDINPGNALLFPWLARIATAYERYKFKKFEIVYQPQVGTSDNGTNCMAIEFDISDEKPATLKELNSYEGAVFSQTFVKNRLSYPVKRLNSFLQALFVQKQGGTSSGEPRTSFMGRLLVATESTAAVVGHLVVKYVVNLSIPEGKSSDVGLFDSYLCTADSLILSSRRFVNSPSPSVLPKPFFDYNGVNEIVFDNVNGRWNTEITNRDSGNWNLLQVSAGGTGLGALFTPGLSSSKNLTLRYATSVGAGLTSAIYFIYYKRTDPAVPATLRVDLFDVSTTLVAILCQVMSVSDKQAQGGLSSHPALTQLIV